jgi:hypothetical protein
LSKKNKPEGDFLFISLAVFLNKFYVYFQKGNFYRAVAETGAERREKGFT